MGVDTRGEEAASASAGGGLGVGVGRVRDDDDSDEARHRRDARFDARRDGDGEKTAEGGREPHYDDYDDDDDDDDRDGGMDERGVIAAPAASYDSDEGGVGNGNSDIPIPPKTPLTMMRSVMSNIHRDRTEIEDGRARERERERARATINDDVGGRGGAASASSTTRRRDGAKTTTAAPPPIPAAASYEDQEYDDGYDDDDYGYDDDIDDDDDDDVFEDDDLYRQRCCAHPTSSIYASSSCIPYGSEVVVRFRNPRVLSSLALRPRGFGGEGGGASSSSASAGRSCFVANESHARLGGAIGRSGAGRFVVVRAGAPASPADRRRRGNEAVSEFDDDGDEAGCADGGDPGDAVLCYGDKIVLRSCAIKRVLGVQKAERRRDGNGNGDREDGDAPPPSSSSAPFLEVGCFRREGRFPQANTWTVLRGGSGAGVVRLGTPSSIAAVEDDRRRRRARGGRRVVPVHSGDPIALLNEWTGGLLSLGEGCGDLLLPPPSPPIGASLGGRSPPDDDDGVVSGWSLNVITSSYQMSPDGAATTQDDEPLIEFLHRRDMCRPRKTETFQIFAADVPHCPGWVYRTAEGGTDRMYLGGSFLNYPNRHDGPGGSLEAEMFPERADDDGGERWGGKASPTDAPSLAEVPIDVQERVLMDEIIGAMMGQEGRYVRYRSPEDGEEEDFDAHEGGDEYDVAPKPRFVLVPPAVLGGRIDAGIENILSGLLPLCTNYAYVNEYVQAGLNCYECGVIARTLCEAINDLLEEYLAFVANLDYLSREVKPPLTLSMVCVEARPATRTMAILSRVVSAVWGKKGGDLLNALHRLMTLNYSGDEKGNELLQHFLTKCAAPYGKMLQTVSSVPWD